MMKKKNLDLFGMEKTRIEKNTKYAEKARAARKSDLGMEKTRIEKNTKHAEKARAARKSDLGMEKTRIEKNTKYAEKARAARKSDLDVKLSKRLHKKLKRMYADHEEEKLRSVRYDGFRSSFYNVHRRLGAKYNKDELRNKNTKLDVRDAENKALQHGRSRQAPLLRDDEAKKRYCRFDRWTDSVASDDSDDVD